MVIPDLRLRAGYEPDDAGEAFASGFDDAEDDDEPPPPASEPEPFDDTELFDDSELVDESDPLPPPARESVR
jgi:hypothetical protein